MGVKKLTLTTLRNTNNGTTIKGSTFLYSMSHLNVESVLELADKISEANSLTDALDSSQHLLSYQLPMDKLEFYLDDV